ncbi:UNVERIFIED_CONTAM: Retrovirus-related Pol polyprotein from transposon RE2 [Sesamum latifolium]|uniref:Retrovirus-related Pol polyprotein from transposon RE2 n=1 Tax=Sesamum latifolium TaxID=2727402 RepID=A0AAW2UU45_9LAMI
MSFTELPPSFWGHALETAVKLLNISPSKSIAQTPYEIWHGKPASYKYLRVWGSPAYVKRLVGDKLDSRSTRESRVPKRYGFVGLTSQLDNDPKTYGEAMSDIDLDKWLEAMKFKMDSMGSNQLGANGEVTAFKARLVAKGYTQRPGVDFEETYSPVAMAKSIWILLAIAAWYGYEIWQMDVKTAFLNGFVEEEIFMDQPEVSLLLEKNRRSVVSKGPSTASSKLPEVVTRILMKSYGVIILSRTTMILVYTRRSVGARLRTLCFMSMTSYSLGMMLRC